MQKQTFIKPSVQEDQINILTQKLLETTSQLSEANNRLTQIEKERTEMLSNISHDLRAPMTAIRSAIDLLLSEQEDMSADHYSTISLIDRRLSTMESLIQDMFYLFKVEDSSRPLDFKQVPAGPFLEEFFYDAIIDTRYDDHEMILDIPENMDCKINVDVQKLVRVLDNLLTNAAKYSGSGTTITLHASCVDSRLVIEVFDNGIGIPAESIPYIFTRTYTVSSARTPGDTSGSGLGLAIVKAIVERHEGTVECISEKGKGCTFRITLPLA